MFALLKNTLMGISCLVIIGLFLGMINAGIDPVSFPYMVHFGTAFPLLYLLNVGMFAIWAWERHRFALYHLGFILIGSGLFAKTARIRFENPKIPESSLTVASHNVGGIMVGKNQPAQQLKTVQDYMQYLKENGDPDILCTQETNWAFDHFLVEKGAYPYHCTMKRGTIIYSRFPVEDYKEIPFEKTNNSVIWAEFRINNKRVRFYNAHLESNRVSIDAEKVIDEGELDNKETWFEIGSVLKRVIRATRTRATQAKKIARQIQECRTPVVFCGDCNDTPYSFTYTTLSEGMNDAFLEKGSGIGSTYDGSLPLLRIDHCFVSPGIAVYDFQTIKNDFSDHNMIVAELGVR